MTVPLKAPVSLAVLSAPPTAAAVQKRCTETFHVVDFGGSLGTVYS